MNPFLKFAGGKRRQVPIIKEYLPKTFNDYYEPFLGGGALFFDLCPKNAYLSDINTKLMCTYRMVRDKLPLVKGYLRKLVNTEDCYYRIRENNFEMGPETQRAAEFIYVNKVCFNGLYRENKSGQFNVSFGKYANPIICNDEMLNAASKALQGIRLSCGDFIQALDGVRKGSIVYLDPPYIPLTATSFTNYTSTGFGLNDHIRLRDYAATLRKRGVKVILSNSSSNLTKELYADWSRQAISAPRSINSKGDERDNVTELLIY